MFVFALLGALRTDDFLQSLSSLPEVLRDLAEADITEKVVRTAIKHPLQKLSDVLSPYLASPLQYGVPGEKLNFNPLHGDYYHYAPKQKQRSPKLGERPPNLLNQCLYEATD